MPAAEPYRAWATFSFTAQSGRINECDLLIAVPANLTAVFTAPPQFTVLQGRRCPKADDLTQLLAWPKYSYLRRQ
ncbi:hypothetical protein ACQEV9_14070 [Streptomyces chartreusis]|uniref:hypothetical protein n=1 Tax=Streptomyces chartreusis TaxID=1969 RepID=UPI003D8CD6A7